MKIHKMPLILALLFSALSSSAFAGDHDVPGPVCDNGQHTGNPHCTDNTPIPGPKGDPGTPGRDGRDGIDGKDGQNGRDGVDGKDGQNGRDGVDGKDGRDGVNGTPGRDGVDGRDGAKGDPGVAGRDGANGKDADMSQVKAWDAQVLVDARSYTDAQSSATLSQANAYTDARVNALSNRFDQFAGQINDRFRQVDRRIDSVMAMSTAYAQMTANTRGDSPNGRVAIGIGEAGGRRAAAIGYGVRSGRMTISLGVGFAGGKTTAGAGFGLDL